MYFDIILHYSVQEKRKKGRWNIVIIPDPSPPTQWWKWWRWYWWWAIAASANHEYPTVTGTVVVFSSSLAVNALWHGPDNDISGEKGSTKRNWPVLEKMANHHTNQKQNEPRRPANPPARLALRLQSNKAARRTGPGPTKNTHNWFAVRYSDNGHCIQIKNMQKLINRYQALLANCSMVICHLSNQHRCAHKEQFISQRALSTDEDQTSTSSGVAMYV